ncbi:MAG TPA: hypothetical protein VH170_01355 [Chthoniobacterales bacterium]|jgi:hypothetical protein|nr:hypothetical protein [Chthoniobacterales bacterium]
MTEAAILKKIDMLNEAVAKLKQRVEDLEDLRDLETAIAENADKPLIPWDKAKVELDIAESEIARVREPEGS